MGMARRTTKVRCLCALEDALTRFGRPEIFNTDQGCQFASAAFTDPLTAAGVRNSMDGRGRWMDNVFIERLWCSLKHEDVYLKGYADGREAHSGIAEWFRFYNNTRPRQGLGNRTPMAVWRRGVSGGLPETVVDMTLRLDNAKSVAHMPTATTANCGLITRERSGPKESNCESLEEAKQQFEQRYKEMKAAGVRPFA
jgi:Integrase core domain